MFRFLGLILVLSAFGSVNAQLSYPPELPGSETVVYKTVGEHDLKMWVFRPAVKRDKTPASPAVVFFFGGGWKKGSPAQFETHCRYLASRGIVAATADYRVSERHGVKANACVEDAKSAVRWLRQHASKFNIDPQRICAGGGSAGGHTACCTALIEGLDAVSELAEVSSVPNALALFNPAVMLSPLQGFETPGIDAEKFVDIATRTGVSPDRISPIHHVRKGMPPTVIFHGTADTAVPFATVEEFSRRMTKAGNRCELKAYPAAPHGFFNAPGTDTSSPGADLRRHWHLRTLRELDRFLQSLGWLEGPCTFQASDHDFVFLRASLHDSFCRFAGEKKGHVAFLGGSITQMEGYRPRICAWLQKRFPDCEFRFTNAGISSTCSTTGAFRLKRDVLDHGSVDLLFVEFAVNDDQDAGHSSENCIRGMEGIIRQTLRHNPSANIIMTNFVNPGMIETLKSGKPVLSAAAHETVARRYNISSVYLSKIVAHQIATGQLTWKQFGGTHPGPEGNQLAADMAISVLEAGWHGVTPEAHLNKEKSATNSRGLPKPVLSASYSNGTLVSLDAAELDSDWSRSVPAWKEISGGKRSQFLGIPMIHTDKPGAMLRLKFNGSAVGAFLLAGPDAGTVETKIDDGEWQATDLYHRFSKGLHYPRTVMFATSLPPGSHELSLRVKRADKEGRGTAVRIHHLVVNGSPQ